MARIEMRDGKPVLVDDWHIEDVISVADCMGVEVTQEQAIQILHNVVDAFDANHGIKWHDFEVEIESIKGKSEIDITTNFVPRMFVIEHPKDRFFLGDIQVSVDTLNNYFHTHDVGWEDADNDDGGTDFTILRE